MILIIGGAYQGKLDYALERFGLTQDLVYFCNETNPDMPQNKQVVYEIDRWILALLKAGADVAEKMDQFANSNRSTVIICNDISCGVVPTNPTMRAWREAVGKSMGLLTQYSDEVIRMYCGIPTRLR